MPYMVLGLALSRGAALLGPTPGGDFFFPLPREKPLERKSCRPGKVQGTKKKEYSIFIYSKNRICPWRGISDVPKASSCI